MSTYQQQPDDFYARKPRQPFNWLWIQIPAVTVLAITLLTGFSMWGWSSSEAEAENSVKTTVESCVGQMTQGMNAIVETSSLNTSQRAFLYKLYADVFGGKEGSTQQLVTFVSTMNGTDLNATTLQVMQVVEAQRMSFAACQGNIRTTQGRLLNTITGPMGSLYAGWFNRPNVLPLSATARPEVDLDGDGKITVLDYPVIAADKVINMQSTGNDAGPIDFNATPKP